MGSLSPDRSAAPAGPVPADPLFTLDSEQQPGFSPEQIDAFRSFSGIPSSPDPHSLLPSRHSLEFDFRRFDPEIPEGSRFVDFPISNGRLPAEHEPLAPVVQPKPLKPAEQFLAPEHLRRRSLPDAPVPWQQEPTRSGLADQPVPPPSSPAPESWGDKAGRTYKNFGNSIYRGMLSEGYQQTAEGFYNLLGHMLGRNPHSNTSTPDLQIQLRIAEQHLAVEQAAIDARRKRERLSRGFAPPAAYGELKEKIRSIQEELGYRHGKGESLTHALRDLLESTQDEAARQRQVTRDFFEVDDDFANSPAGAVSQTIGSLATLPLNASPLVVPVSVSQTYQSAYDDYVQSRERQGLPVDRDDAERAAATYLATSGPIQLALDKLVVGRLLKPIAGKATVGQALSRLTLASVAGGFSNALDQLTMNTVANTLQGYDLNRPFTQGLLENAVMGAALSHLGRNGQHPEAPDASRVNFDPERANTQFAPYTVSPLASPSNESPGTPSSNPPARRSFGERRASDDDQPDRPYTAAEHAKADEVVRRELKAFKDILDDLGVDYDTGHGNRNVITGEDELLVLYSIGDLTKREKDAVRKGEKWGTATRFSLREELIHVAYLIGLRKEWEKSDFEGTFGDYIDVENSKVFDNIRETIESAKGEQRKLLTQALFDSFNLYKKELDEDLPEMTPEEFFSDMETQDMKMEFVAEFLRQAAQLKRQGRINEELFALVKEKLWPWVMKAIARIRSILPNAYEGGFGPEVKHRLEMLEKELDSIWPSS